ncbi:MAG: hypothetical protein MUF86_12080 [Akkermansiaceae bacterium]|nr:hypothetical protein [Akkermansiaceae bacterium]
MKLPHPPRGGRSLIQGLACLGVIGMAFAQQDTPRGTLNVDRSLVQVGTRTQLDWKIQYPSVVTDLVSVTNTGTIIPKSTMKMKVRTLGVAFQSGKTLLPLEGYWAKNNGKFTRFFYGTGPQVNPSSVLVNETVNVNDRIDFSGRGWSGSSWYPMHDTRSADPYVVVLKNGDRAPNYAPAYNQSTVKGFLSSYIDGMGRIKIGPRDLIILWEASTAKPGTTYFDMQDLVVLVTFE